MDRNYKATKEAGCGSADNSSLANTNPPLPICHYRSTVRIDDLAITYLEDGTIGLKRDGATCTVSRAELHQIFTLSHQLEDYNSASKKSRLGIINSVIEEYQDSINRLKSQLSTLNGHSS